MDLAVWWRARRWRGLLELIDQLSSTSRLREAFVNDPEQAELLAGIPESDEPWSPRVSEFDLNAQLLTQIHGAITAMFQQLVALGGHKPPTMEPLPTPVTEVQRARARLEQARIDLLDAMFSPKGD